VRIYLSERCISLTAVFVCLIVLDGHVGEVPRADVRAERDVLTVVHHFELTRRCGMNCEVALDRVTGTIST
jgi:hypothetical protein